MRKLFYRLTGGRPMERLEYYFHDVVDHKDIYLYLDKLNRKWMAQGAWALFRVRSKR